MTERPHYSKRKPRLAGKVPRPKFIANDRDATRLQLRERLLRMILENERIRRHEQRPNAS